MAHKIRVALGADIKREAVLIDPSVSAAEPTFTAESAENANDFPNSNIIASGKNSRQLLKEIYGR
jgi:hypothetical protein